MKSPINQPYDYIRAKLNHTEFPEYPDILSNYRWADPKATDELEIFIVEPKIIKKSDNIIIDDEITVLGIDTIVVDFGSEFAGWLEVDIPNLKGQITLGISEYNEPAIVNLGPKSPSKTKTPIKYGDTYRLELNDELYEGVRFGFINIVAFKEKFTIKQIRLVCQTKPVNYNGSFYCDNELLNRIWYNGAYSIRTNLTKDYFSAILMDRGDRYSWTGDAYPAQDGALTAFGNYDFIYQNLVYTSTRGNSIPSYELYWIFSVINYYRYTGDKEGIKKLLGEVVIRLDDAINNFDKDLNLVFFGWDERLGAGFENPNIDSNKNSYKFLTIRALKDCLQYLGEFISPKYKGILNKLINKLNFSHMNLHSTSDAINAHVIPKEQLEELYNIYFTDPVNRLSYSPFNEYFILQAMAKLNKHTDAIDCILDMFGGQVEYGGTSFFEVYRPCWNNEIGKLHAPINNQAGYTSLNHPWGSGVINFLNEEILGIKPKNSGFKEFDIKPHLSTQLTHIKGTTPTTYGAISAEFDFNNNLCKFIIPKGTIGNISIPKFGQTATVNFEFKKQDEEYIYLNPLPEGEYEFQVCYNVDVMEHIEKEYSYKAKYLGENLKSKYGKDGFYGDKNSNLLPSYVEKIVSNKEIVRDNGVLTTNDYQACFQTFTIDIYLRQAATVTLYFNDYDDENRRQAVEMFDLESLELITPIKVIKDFSKGKYLSFFYNKPLRFRINQIRGINAVLNGIFFDS